MRCKVPKNFLGILKRNAGCTPKILDRASKLSRDQLEFSTDAEVISIGKMVSAVLGEAHMMKAFVRLKPQGEKVLHGYMRPEHDVWYPVGRFFAMRFPGTLVVLGNNTQSRVFLYDGKELNQSRGGSLAGTLKKIGESLGNDASAAPEKLWDAYYWSQYRPEAKNTPYFRQNMRRKYVKEAGITAESDSGGTRLEDFS